MKFLAMFSINRPEDHDFLVQMKHSDGFVMRVLVANPKLARPMMISRLLIAPAIIAIKMLNPGYFSMLATSTLLCQLAKSG